jgi:hypothetical protein
MRETIRSGSTAPICTRTESTFIVVTGNLWDSYPSRTPMPVRVRTNGRYGCTWNEKC